MKGAVWQLRVENVQDQVELALMRKRTS